VRKKSKEKFKLIIFQNNKQHHKIKDYSLKSAAFKRYEELREKNKKNTLVPKTQISTCGRLKTVRYELVLMQKDIDNKLKPRKYLNEFGEWVQERALGGWVIIKKCEWLEEEEFWVSNLKKRHTFNEIVKNLLEPRFGFFTNVFIFLNKVVIDDGQNIDIIQCKTEKEAFILYELIKSYMIKNKKIEFLFTGYISADMRKKIRPRLVEITGLNRREFYRRASAKPEKMGVK